VTSRGIHHLTTIIGEAPRVASFYPDILGLRRVKKTVCYDDPGSYHIYFGDMVGSPGTIISALAWQSVPPGMVGVGEVVQTAFRVAAGSLDGWAERLNEAKIVFRHDRSPSREPMLCFADPEGTSLALVDPKVDQIVAAASNSHWSVCGLHEVTLNVREADATVGIVQDVLGFECVSNERGLMRFVAHDGPGGLLSLREIGPSSRGRLGGGTIRHVAFRAADIDDRSEMVEKLRKDYGIAVTDPIERTYLNAVGFRAPCGVLFEIATDGPGFAVDEAPESLGANLKLPPFLEGRRSELESILPPMK
jgi:glyoxalase family protein